MMFSFVLVSVRDFFWFPYISFTLWIPEAELSHYAICISGFNVGFTIFSTNNEPHEFVSPLAPHLIIL